MPFLSPNQQCQSTEGKISHSMDLLTPSSPTHHLPTLSLTTNSSWLPWGRVAMPLISPQMPVPLVSWKIWKQKIPKRTQKLKRWIDRLLTAAALLVTTEKFAVSKHKCRTNTDWSSVGTSPAQNEPTADVQVPAAAPAC